MATPWFLTKTCLNTLKYAPLLGFAMYLGHLMDRRTDIRMSDFHNKSKLFGGKELAEGERVW